LVLVVTRATRVDHYLLYYEGENMKGDYGKLGDILLSLDKAFDRAMTLTRNSDIVLDAIESARDSVLTAREKEII
jgi:hypothetical protein